MLPTVSVAELTAELVRVPPTGAQRHVAVAEILADLAFHEVRGNAERARHGRAADRPGIGRRDHRRGPVAVPSRG